MLLIQTHFPESFNSFLILLSWYWFRYLPYKKHLVAQSLEVWPSAYKDGTDWVSFFTLHRSCLHQHWSLWVPPTTGSLCELSLWRSRTNSISKVPSWKKIETNPASDAEKIAIRAWSNKPMLLKFSKVLVSHYMEDVLLISNQYLNTCLTFIKINEVPDSSWWTTSWWLPDQWNIWRQMTNQHIKRCPKRKSELMTWGYIKILTHQTETLGKQKHYSTWKIYCVRDPGRPPVSGRPWQMGDKWRELGYRVYLVGTGRV